MGKINVLSFAVANLIAAGEVVDRPASVIKELMENSIDAGADRITVEIQNGGVSFMRVTDNGCGISSEDLPVAIRRHATSKIKTAEDLDGILTLGFRGEALAAIASVSDMRIISRTADAPMACVLEAHGGEISGIYEQGGSVGTSVIIENLFANVPARRKFLKKDVAESMAVTANVERVALSHPEIAFRLIIDGNTRLDTAGDGRLQNTVHAVFGKELASRLIEVESEQDGISVHGFIGRSDNFKANRNYESFFINGRYVKSKTAMAAVEQAYTSYMPPEKFPVCILFITIPPSRVDVNVHPAKLEVKFSNEKPVFEAIYYTVRSALENNVTRPNVQLQFGNSRGRASGFQSRLSESKLPINDRNARNEQLRMPRELQTKPQERISAAEYRSLYDPLPTKKGQPSLVPTREPVTVDNSKKIPNVTVHLPDANDAPNLGKPVSIPVSAPAPTSVQAPTPPAETADPTVEAQNAAPIANEAPVQPKAPEPAAPSTAWRIIGEAFHSYVLVEADEKLLIIDKHAAHERILFEQLKAGLAKADTVSQLLMLPIDVLLTSAEVEALRDYHGELEKIGFSLRYARNTVSADAIPEGVDSAAVPAMLESMAGRILDATGSVKLTRDILFEKALYQAACKAAIKAGRAYADEHIKWLVAKLMELPDITFCPHGRPVALELTHRTLDNQFDRTGF